MNTHVITETLHSASCALANALDVLLAPPCWRRSRKRLASYAHLNERSLADFGLTRDHLHEIRTRWPAGTVRSMIIDGS
jgi:uncharacterized protein YjiS (DUF1127 family)